MNRVYVYIYIMWCGSLSELLVEWTLNKIKNSKWTIMLKRFVCIFDIYVHIILRVCKSDFYLIFAIFPLFVSKFFIVYGKWGHNKLRILFAPYVWQNLSLRKLQKCWINKNLKNSFQLPPRFYQLHETKSNL